MQSRRRNSNAWWCILLLIGCCVPILPASGFEPPHRAIVVSPYIRMISTRKFSVFSPDAPPSRHDSIGTVKDQTGFGIGLRLSTQLSDRWSYFFDYVSSPLEVEAQPSNKQGLIIFTLGISYSLDAIGGKMMLDLGYGASHWGKEWTEMTFYPSIGYSKQLTRRIAGFVNIGCPIVNDWFIKAGIEEHYSSFTLSSGLRFFL